MRPIYRFFLLLSAVTAWAQSPTRVDTIWSARWVVTMDAQRRVIENGAVAIAGDHIVVTWARVIQGELQRCAAER